MGPLGKKTFSLHIIKKKTTDQFYKFYIELKDLDFNNCSWFPNFVTSSTDANFSPFDNYPFQPHDVKRVLAKFNKKCAPSPDGIAYSVLFKLESIHHIIATHKIYTHGTPLSYWNQ